MTLRITNPALRPPVKRPVPFRYRSRLCAGSLFYVVYQTPDLKATGQEKIVLLQKQPSDMEYYDILMHKKKGR